MTDKSPLLLTEDLISRVRLLLSRRHAAIRFDMPLERAFVAQRREDFRSNVAQGGLGIVLLFVCVVGGSYITFKPSVQDLPLWITTVATTACSILFGLAAGVVPSMLRHFQLYVGLFAGLGLYVMTLASLLYDDRILAQHASFIVMLIITIITLSLRLLLSASTITCIVFGTAAALTAHYMGVHINWILLSHYLVGSTGVSLFVAYLLERHERKSFLQSLLLEWESQQLDILNQRLDELARRDQLSGLANRRHLDEMLEDEWDRARREQTPMALLFVDVDHFKRFNDTYGHQAGDICLTRIGQLLSRTLKRPADLAARYGGEEFVLLLPNTDIGGASRVADRIIQQVDELQIPHQSSDVASHITVSIGVAAMVPDANSRVQDLLTLADEALYASKSAGRHRQTLATSSITASATCV